MDIVSHRPRAEEVCTSLRGANDNMSSAPVVIVGAGLAGLACAQRLTRAGTDITVLEASDGAMALRVAAEEVGEIDLVLTDVEMPTLGGRGMVDELHELSPGMRVLFMSGYTDNEILRRGIRASETEFLQKPFTAETLCAAVRTVLSKPATKLV